LNDRLDTQFLVQLAFQRDVRQLTRLNVPAGQIPGVRIPLALWRSMHEKHTIASTQRCSHHDMLTRLTVIHRASLTEASCIASSRASVA
jgi:hypothetical protein